MACVNTKHPEFKKLASQLGESLAESIVVANGDKIPSLEEAISIIRGANVKQYKKATKYLQTTKSADVDGLVNNLNRILQKYNDGYYVVKGAKLNKKAAPIAAIEIQNKHIAFLNALNDEFGKIFTVGAADVAPAVSAQQMAVRGAIANDPRVFNNLTEDGQGNYVFFHYSNSDLSKKGIDPNKFGNNTNLTGRDEAGRSVKVSLFYTDNQIAEPGLGNFKHAVRIPESEVYPFNTDPLGFLGEAEKRFKEAYPNRAFNPNEQIGWIGKVAGEHGFKMTVGYWDNGKQKVLRAETTEKLKPELMQAPLTGGFYGSNAVKTLTEEKFKNNKVRYKNKTKEYFQKVAAIPDATLQNESVKGADTIYNTNDSLKSIGTEEQYNQYLSTIFPDSKVKDVLYHRSKDEFENFDFTKVNKDTGGGFDFGTESNATQYGENLHSVLLDIQDFKQSYERTSKTDGTLYEGNGVHKGDVYSVYDAEQIHQLGSKEDIAGFKEFVENNQTSSPSSIHPDTIKVSINQNALNDLAQKNRDDAKDTADLFQKQIPDEDNPGSFMDIYNARERKSEFAIHNVVDMLENKFRIPFTFENDPNGKYRAVYRNGGVVINQALVNSDTPFHEIAHPFLLALKEENPDVYSSLSNDLGSSEEGQAILAQVQQTYPELSPDEQIDEAIAEHVGKLSASKLLEIKPWYQQFINWLKGALTKMGVYTQGFKTDMTLNDFANLIVDPNFKVDLSNKQGHEARDDYYQKVGASNFDEMMDTIVQKLRADSKNFSKNSSSEEQTRKYISSKQADDISKNRRDLKAINNFVFSSVMNLKNLNDRFEDFKKAYDAKTSKSNADVKNLANILTEVENAVSLYEDVDLLLDAVMNEFTEDELENANISNLNKNYRKEAALIRSYGKYAKEVISEWLVQTPNAKKALNQAIANNNVTHLVPQISFDKVAAELKQNGILDKKTILREAFKRELGDYLITAKKDASALTQFLGPLIHSRDPLSSLIAIAVTDEYTKAVKKGVAIQHHLKDLVKRERGSLKAFTSNDEQKAFYSKYMRKALNYEYKGLGKDLKPEYHEVERDAFHEEYKWDIFAKAKREFEEKLGPRPSKNATRYDAWKKSRDAWYAANAVQTTDANGKITTVPGTQYRNAEFQMLKNDALFQQMYAAYKDANDGLGSARLKNGIIPQDKISNISFDKANLAKDITEKVRLFAGEDDQVYFSQKNNLEEKRNVPAGYTRLIDEKELSYDMLNSISKFAIAAEKYKSISNIEPHVNILKNFIGGNSTLDISKRSVVRTNASGIKALSKVENKIMRVEAERLNNQLDAFLNDVVYGESMKKEAIQVMDSKYTVEDKNGNKQTIRGFENVTQTTGIHNLDYSGFKVGEQREVGDYKITMLRKDWNFSTKKVGNRLGLLTALSNMALNPTSGIVNVVRAKLETFVEGAGGRYFNLRDAAKGEAEYFKALGSGDFMEDLLGGKPSFLSSMIIDYDAIQGELLDEAGRKVPGSIANKLFRRNHLFFMQNGGEHYVQTHLMIAMMNHEKVQLKSGGSISLLEAKQKEHAGTLDIKKDTTWTADDDQAFKNNLKFVNTTMHGNFNKLDKAYLQRTWWGSLVMMFRKHLYTGFASRYRSGYVNYQTGQYTEGYYRTFAAGLLRQVRSIVENKRMAKWSDFNEQEKYAFRKIGADLAVFALLITMFKLFDDDDDVNEANDYAALISRRLISEAVQYTPVVGTLDLARVVTNPSASASTVDKLYKALYQSISDPTEEYTRSGAGYQAGDNKALTMWGRALPIYKQAVNTVEPERLLQFYQLNSLDFFKPSAEKNGDNK